MEKEKLDQVMSPDVPKEGKEQILLEKGSLVMLDHVPRCVNDDFFPLKGDADVIDVIVGLASRNVFLHRRTTQTVAANVFQASRNSFKMIR